MRSFRLVLILSALVSVSGCEFEEFYWPGCPTPPIDAGGGNGGTGGAGGQGGNAVGGQGGASDGGGGAGPRPCPFPAETPPED